MIDCAIWLLQMQQIVQTASENVPALERYEAVPGCLTQSGIQA